MEIVKLKKTKKVKCYLDLSNEDNAIVSRKSVHRIGFKDFFLNVCISVSTSGSQSFLRTRQGKKPKHNYRILSKFTVKDLLPFIRDMA